MNDALIGLVGVMAGGLLAGGVAWSLEWRRDRRLMRAAARLIQDELDADWVNLGKALSAIRLFLAGFGERPKAPELTLDAWKRHKQELAPALNKREWDAVWSATACVRNIQVWLAEEAEEEMRFWLEEGELRDAVELTVLPWVSEILDGKEALDRAVGVPWRKRRGNKAAKERTRAKTLELFAALVGGQSSSPTQRKETTAPAAARES